MAPEWCFLLTLQKLVLKAMSPSTRVYLVPDSSEVCTAEEAWKVKQIELGKLAEESCTLESFSGRTWIEISETELFTSFAGLYILQTPLQSARFPHRCNEAGISTLEWELGLLGMANAATCGFSTSELAAP